MSLGLGLGLGLTRANMGDMAIFRRKLARSWVAWRDGTMTPGGGAGNALHPATGVVQSGPMTMDLFGLRFGFAWDQITNLWPVLSASSGSVTSAINGTGTVRTVTEGAGASADHTYYRAMPLTDGLSYTLVGTLVRTAGNRHGCLLVSRSGHYVRLLVNMDTGVLTVAVSGVVVASSSVVAQGSGRFKVTCTFSDAAWGGTPIAGLSLSESGDTLTWSYTGDGTSGIAFEGVTLTPATDYAPRLAEAITRTADSWIWATPGAVPQNCEITHLLLQPYASGDMGITAQTWMMRKTATPESTTLLRGSATTMTAQTNDGTTTVADDVTRTLPAAGVLCVQRRVRRATQVEAGYGATLSGSPTTCGTSADETAFYLNHSSTAGRAGRCASAYIITPGECPQYERDAETRLFHLRTVPLAA